MKDDFDAVRPWLVDCMNILDVAGRFDVAEGSFDLGGTEQSKWNGQDALGNVGRWGRRHSTVENVKPAPQYQCEKSKVHK